jgi:hypothetical protein
MLTVVLRRQRKLFFLQFRCPCEVRANERTKERKKERNDDDEHEGKRTGSYSRLIDEKQRRKSVEERSQRQQSNKI